MAFLLRIGFWFSLVLLLLPFDFGGKDADAPSVSPLQTFFAAKEAVTDVAVLCERKPDVCETGRAAFDTISVRALESARMAIEMVEAEPAVEGASVPAALAPMPAGNLAAAPAAVPSVQQAAEASAASSSTIPVPSARPLDAPHR